MTFAYIKTIKQLRRPHYWLPLSLLLVSGCSSHQYGDLEKWIAETKESTRVPLPEMKPPQTYDAFAYLAKDMRDPFTAFLEEPSEQTQTTTGPRPGWVREALEQFPLDSLQFVGTLEKNGVQWGLVQGPDNTIYRVQVGNHIGKNYGEIVAISERAVMIKELIPNGSGGWVSRESTLAIPEL